MAKSQSAKKQVSEFAFLIQYAVGGNVEINSGVDFPGESIEPYVGTSLNFGDKDFNDDELILVEVATR